MRLLIAEKRDAAEKIAAACGWTKGAGCYEGTYGGHEWRLVWASGHLITLKTPQEVRDDISWNDPSTLTPIPQAFPRKIVEARAGAPPAAHPSNYLRNIQKGLAGITEVIIGTDADREGEAIGWTILEWLNWTGPVKRAWFAAGLDKKSLTEALSTLRPPERTKGWYRASEARSRSDWAFMNLVRAYTFYASYGKFGAHLGQGSGREAVMSVGRVQTPTLSLIVRRDLDIEGFIARDHFKVAADFAVATNGAAQVYAGKYSPVITREIIDAQPPGVHWEPSSKVPEDGEPDPLDSPLFTDKQRVDQFGSSLRNAKASLTSYSKGTTTEAPAKTFCLSDAQVTIGKACKISANLAQIILEDLYEQGFTSYARTSKSELPRNLYEPSERNAVLAAVRQISGLTEAADRAVRIHNGSDASCPAFLPKVFTDKNLEHHGIIPTHTIMDAAALAKMSPKKSNERGRVEHTSDQMRQAYILVAKQYIRALFPPAKYETQEAVTEAAIAGLLGESPARFLSKGKKIIDLGWRAAFDEKAPDDVIIPELTQGGDVTVNNVHVSASKTTPPKRYTEATLPKAMENIAKEVKDPALRRTLRQSEGIGTPATRKEVVNTLLARGYVVVKKAAYYSTDKGRDLVSNVEGWLASPEETAQWEDYLVKICDEQNDARSEAMRNQFVQATIKRVEAIITSLQSNHDGNLGERNRRTPPKVTPGMKRIMQLIESKLGVAIPPGAMSDPKKSVDFIETHKGSLPEDDGKPSQSQIDLVKKIAANAKGDVVVPESVMTERAACKSFLDANIGKLPPTEGQLKFARSLIEQLPESERPDEAVLATSQGCSKIIDKLKKPSSGGKGKSPRSGSRAPVKRARRKTAS